MRILRLESTDGEILWGHEHPDGTVTALAADPVEAPVEDTGRAVEPARILAPVVPRAIIGIGLNYRQHARETGQPLPDHPVVFMKNPAAVQDPGAPIVIPRSCAEVPEVDYEVELAVVIGRAARDVPADRALEHVLGYTVGNDVSARRWQKHGGAGQWVRGKSFDTFCPLGPALVTRDDVPDPQDLPLVTRLNGEIMQSSNTSDMVFGVAQLVALLSVDTTLLPGTVILTGTPEGVGFVRDPKVFLAPGDEVVVEVGGIGALVNPVVSA